jgi:hypothetical protein
MPLAKIGVDHSPRTWVLDALAPIALPIVASIGAGATGSTPQATLFLPFNYKIAKIGVYVSTIDAVAGGDAFNLVVDALPYGGDGTFASQTYTVAGTPTTTDTIKATIGGTEVDQAQTTTQTVDALAALLAAAINANSTVNKLVHAVASGSGGVLTVTALEAGTAGNAITTVGATTGGATLTAGGATLTGGGATYSQNNPTPNDNSNTYDPTLQPGQSSLGFPTNFASAGQTLFANDVPFNAANSYASNPNGISGDLTGRAVGNTGWVSLQTGGGYGIFVPTNFDAAYSEATILTLRATTVASTGAIAGLHVVAFVSPMGHRAGPYPPGVIFEPGQDY